MNKYSIIRDNIMSHCLHSTNQAIITIPTAGDLFFASKGMRLNALDLPYIAILLGHYGNTNITINTLGLFLANMRSDGFIPRIIDMDKRMEAANPYRRFERNEHANPVLFQTAYYIACLRGGDVAWLSEEWYEKLKRYLRHWFKYWVRSSSGLCVWNSASHSGMDTAFDRAGSWKGLFCEGVDLNSELYAELCCAQKLAALLRHEVDASAFCNKAEAQRSRIQKYLWDENDGFFYDRDLRNGKHIRIRHVGCLNALLHGIAEREQTERIIRGRILNPEEFLTKYPAPAYSLREGICHCGYEPDTSADTLYTFESGHADWKSGMWPGKTYMITHILKLHGFDGEAYRIAENLATLVEGETGLCEWYDPASGEGFGRRPCFDAPTLLTLFLRNELEIGLQPYQPDPTILGYEMELQKKHDIQMIPSRL